MSVKGATGRHNLSGFLSFRLRLGLSPLRPYRDLSDGDLPGRLRSHRKSVGRATRKVPPGVVVTDSSGTGVSAREEEDDDYERYEGGGGNRFE